MSTLMTRAVALMVVTLILAACGQTDAVSSPTSPASPASPSAPEPTPRPDPSGPESPVPSTPVATPMPSGSDAPVAPPTGSPVAYRWGDAVRVIVDGLAVRRAPFTDAELVEALVYDPDSQDRVASGERVRLNEGTIVWIELGPLVLDGIPWYRVHAGMQPGETPEEMTTWDADGDGEGSDSGWIAGRSADGGYLELVPPDPAEPMAPEPLVVAAGVWDFTSDLFPASFQVGGSFAIAEGGSAGCEFTVTLQPTGEVLVDTTLDAPFETVDFDSDATDPLPDGEYTVEVQAGVPGDLEAECPWALVVLQNVG